MKVFAQPGYRQFAYVNEELPDVFAATTVVVSTRGRKRGV